MIVKKRNFFKLLENLNNIFDKLIEEKGNKKEIIIENIIMSKNGSKIYKNIKVNIKNKENYNIRFYKNEEDIFEFYFKNKKGNLESFSFKEIDEEIIEEEVLDCYNILLNLKIIKLYKF